MSDFATELDEEFAPLIRLSIKLSRLQAHGLGEDAVLILPAEKWPGATAAIGLRIVRADVLEPMLGLPGDL